MFRFGAIGEPSTARWVTAIVVVGHDGMGIEKYARDRKVCKLHLRYLKTILAWARYASELYMQGTDYPTDARGVRSGIAPPYQ